MKDHKLENSRARSTGRSEGGWRGGGFASERPFRAVDQ